MFFRQIFEPNLAQYSYLIGCQRTGEAIVIDPMRDIDRYIDVAASEDLRIVAIAETHIHADYLSGAREFAERLGVALYLSDEGDANWKYVWAREGSYDFRPMKHKDRFKIGNIQFEVVHTAGHTPEHISFLITDLGGGANEPMGMATGDFVFVGDLGRPDLLESAAGQAGAMEPSARRLYASVQEFLDLPDYLQIWPGHGAGSACGKALGAVPESTVGYERRFNASILAAQEGENVFVERILDGQPEPPMYFARMKHENKTGPRVLGALPHPKPVSAGDLAALSGRDDVVVLDTRADSNAFMKGHLAGSLYAPMGKTLNTIAGSYVQPEQAIYLIVDAVDDVREAVLNLIRIGLDHIVGYAPASELAALDLASTPIIDTRSLETARQRPGAKVLDVRRLAEFEEGHVPGAINIAHTRLLLRSGELENTGTYLVHCRSGARAAAATSLLDRLGYDVVYVDGMYADWASHHKEEKGKPVEVL
ncbi:MAG: MBL fold metallo-hydrolase [Rhodothermales bacterium]